MVMQFLQGPDLHGMDGQFRRPMQTENKYMKAVRRLEAFHENLFESNRNKIHSANRGVIILFNVLGRGKDLCEGLGELKLSKLGGNALIVGTVYKRDPFSAISLKFSELQSLISTHRSPNPIATSKKA